MGRGGNRGGTEVGNGSLDELMVAGGDSPTLERYRLARAHMVELELERNAGPCCPATWPATRWDVSPLSCGGTANDVESGTVPRRSLLSTRRSTKLSG